jgi:glycosidase
LYDAIRRLTRNEPNASAWDINSVWNNDCRSIDEHMLRFMENHDEQRIASADFAGNPWLAVPGMIVSATLNVGPVMIYFGQEVGEPANGAEGFSSSDGRTSIFDYWGVPEHQKWLNGGKMDGGQLSDDQKNLRGFYGKLLNLVRDKEALREGEFWELMVANEHQQGFDQRLYLFLRYTDKQRILVITNFNRDERRLQVKFPADLLGKLQITGSEEFTELLSGTKYNTNDISDGVEINLSATSGVLLEF